MSYVYSCLTLTLTLILALSLLSCSKKQDASSSVRIIEVGPRILAGYYASELAESKNIPAVHIRIADNRTYAYTALWYECENKISAQYSQSGITFTSSSNAAGGPSVFVVGKPCKIESEIMASSATSIKVGVKINGGSQVVYELPLVSSEKFLNIINMLSSWSNSFSSDEVACLGSFNASCIQVGLKNKDN
jgi:hypothetical protein